MAKRLLLFSFLVVAILGATTTQAQQALPKGTSYEVMLTWAAPTTSPDPVAGYQVFYAPAGTSTYTLIGSTAVNVLTYADQGAWVVPGADLSYVVESVDALGTTSPPSNVATVPIPGPGSLGGRATLGTITATS